MLNYLEAYKDFYLWDIFAYERISDVADPGMSGYLKHKEQKASVYS